MEKSMFLCLARLIREPGLVQTPNYYTSDIYTTLFFGFLVQIHCSNLKNFKKNCINFVKNLFFGFDYLVISLYISLPYIN